MLLKPNLKHHCWRDQSGSIFPLVLACLLLLAVLILSWIEVTSLYLAQKRVDSAAEQLAYVATSGFEYQIYSGGVRAELNEAKAREEINRFLSTTGSNMVLIDVEISDELSANVSLGDSWSTVLLPNFLGINIDLVSERNSRLLLLNE